MDSVADVNNCALSESNARMDTTDNQFEDLSSGSDDEWLGVEEEVPLTLQTLCIFCPEIFNSAELMFEHCHSQHIFDIVTYSRRMGLNCINYIKFINYVRSHTLSSSEIMEFSKNTAPWLRDKYMKPHDASDPLLTFDIESYIKKKLSERSDADDNITMPSSHFESILQKLARKEMKLQNAYDRIDRMKEAAKTVLLCPNQSSTPSHTTSNSRMSEESRSNDDDDHYFSTYDHFAIHHEMLQDDVRTLSYQEAILKNPEVFHQKKVLDVGCGTAILSMFAAKAGAAEVMGVDKSDVIFQAMDIVRENGFDPVINLFRGRVEDMPIPDAKVDVIVSEWMGYFLLFEGMLDSVIYARDKFLAPGGHMFPDRCTISLLAVCDMAKYKQYVEFWNDVYGFKMSAMKKDVIKEANVEAVSAEVACSDPVIVKELDLTYCAVEDTEFVSPFELVMTKSCKVTAIVGYFDSFFERGLKHKVLLSTSPKAKQTHWKQTMFLLPNPVEVNKGDSIACKITCRKNRRDPRSLIVKINFGESQNFYYLS
ncbi:uncharacterized protein LOC129234512 [Uloborus diversus]|uniref:uncharacterized protein LOC129234512 n=1 Tax=Uloborus diversus TaxID=327109 RepID=UPI00240A3D8B|nr:uncharacterized protein LOC129234512 [Uloborus diversus]